MKIILSISLLFFSVLASGQKMPSDYFDVAGNYLEDNKFDEALKEYQYIVDNYTENELYPRAFYNVGYIHLIQKRYGQAIPVFMKILESSFNEQEDSGGDIMDDPYTNFKNRASKILSDIYYEKQKFDSALYFFALSDSVYPYLHFCGNEYASNDIYTALRYSDIYQKLNQPENAIEKLLPAVFITLADNSKVIEELEKLLSGKKNLKTELDNSLNQIYSRKIDRDNYSYTKYYFRFLNTEIQVPDSYEYGKEELDIDKARMEIRQTSFYKMLEKLE